MVVAVHDTRGAATGERMKPQEGIVYFVVGSGDS
jgi:hypothetical protein